MGSETARQPIVRRADLAGPDAAAVAGLVRAYLVQTEREKAEQLGAGHSGGGALPERYLEEVDRPERAYENAIVHLAEVGTSPTGVVVVQQAEAVREIKRLWVDPGARGMRVGALLMDAAIGGADLPLRLTVWEWRRDAIRLYTSQGFVPVPSWDDRPHLLCMERMLTR